jgi:competence protein ComEC
MKDFVLRTPFFRIYLALAGGVLLNEIFPFVHLFLPFFILSGLIFLFHLYIQKSEILFKLRWLFGCGVFLFFAGTGLFIAQNFERKTAFSVLDKSGIFELEVKKVPVEKTKSFAVEVTALQFAADSVHFFSAKGNGLLYLAKTEEVETLRVGDRILVATTFATPKKNSNPEGFDFSEYLRRKGLRATAYASADNWQKSFSFDGFSIWQMASDCRKHLLTIYREQGISGDEFAVLGALTLGFKDEIRDELYTSYSNSGALHILAVSGLHVGIIYVIFSLIFSFLDKSTQARLIKSLIIILLLWLYAFITGLSPSVMRASLMFSIVAFGQIFSFKSKIYNSVFFSAFVLLFVNPNFIFDVSYLLSYSAVLGIVFFQPKLKQLLCFKNKIAAWSWDLFCVSIAAQIGTFPLGIYYFYKFSNYFLLTNFIAIPLATAIIYLAVLLLVVSSFSELAHWVGVVLNGLLKAQNESIMFIDFLPYSVSRIWISTIDIFLLYFMVLCFTLFILRKKPWVLILGLTVLLSVQVEAFVRTIRLKNETNIIVYEDNRGFSVDFMSAQNHYLFTTDEKHTRNLAGNFWLKKDNITYQAMNVSPNCKDGFFSFEGKRICLLYKNDLHWKTASQKAEVDYLIIGNGVNISSQDIDNLFSPKEIVLDASISNYRVEEIRKYSLERGIVCYSIAEKGAWIKELQ